MIKIDLISSKYLYIIYILYTCYHKRAKKTWFIIIINIIMTLFKII